jgi:predicted PurR-regulated permease PerM
VSDAAAPGASAGPPAPGGTPRARAVFLAVSGAVAAAVIVAAHQVLLPFVLALVVAYVLTPAVLRVQKRASVPRWAAILLVYAVTLSSIGGFISQVVPRLVGEGMSLAREWPKLTSTLRAEWLPAVDRKLSAWQGEEPSPPAVIDADEDGKPDEKPPPFRLVHRDDGSYDVRVSDDVRFREKREGVWAIEQAEPRRGISTAQMLRDGFDKGVAYLKENSIEVLKFGREVVFAVSRSIFTLFMTLMLAGYMILSHEKILRFFRDLTGPDSAPSFDRFLLRLDRGLAGVVRGQLIICLLNGVLSAVGFWLFGLKYWPILAVVAAVFSLIPIFGSILSSVPAVAIGLTQSPGTAFGVLIWIIGIHQLEANFLNPKIIGDAAKIHPVLVVFSLIAGEHFGGLTGALFAVPCMSIAQTIFLHFRETTLGIADPITPPPGTRRKPAEAPDGDPAHGTLPTPPAPKKKSDPPPAQAGKKRVPSAGAGSKASTIKE